MSCYVLDTDHITLFQYNHPAIAARARMIGGSTIFVTVVTLEEQSRGRLAGVSRAATKPDQLAIAYENLIKTQHYFYRVNLLKFDDAAHDRYQSLLRRRVRIGTQDLRIAAIALANQAVLVTRNWQDFGKVPDLELEDWTLESNSDSPYPQR